ncbi:MAG: alkaline phosphatase family protein [Gemmatimonadota bacterium]
MTSLRWSALVCATALVACGSPEKKVLLIGLDGVRVDILAEAYTPNLDRLIAEGTFSDAVVTAEPTVSGPDWSSMLTGVWPEKHGVHSNDFAGNQYATWPDFLTRLEQIDASFATYAVLDWPPLGTTASGGPLVSDMVDVKDTIDGDALGYRDADSLSVAAAVEYLSTQTVDAAFVYLGDIDVVGHEVGSLADEYRESIEWSDGQVGLLLQALERRPTYADEDWLILVATDHGRRDDGGHGGSSKLERTVFIIASGPAVVAGADVVMPSAIVDVAATALAHLGHFDPAWDLDGRPIVN